ncbi:Mpv17/PMP22 family protein [Coprobacter fastidiosus]|jgi:hypothetical protein|uniref:Mpv17/PMP22 family protein n=1 Tax=Coprobacter fastidiosus TaxID=1099853 RepID=UPI000EFE4380|nr:Mpv17/PMP22 family protein [Coprobacter fastidiosus]RHO59101.1 hypothetical protein DW107_05945 [Tannerella sp. AM09-19]
MKTKDLLFGGIIILCFLPFFISESFYNGYTEYNGSHPYIMAFFKFAILATLGEVIGLRIKKGIYNEPGFGILPRAIIWGFLGMWIAVAMKTFSSGVPYLLQSFGIEGVPDAMKQSLSMEKVLGAFFISVMMNTTFGPVFMTLHKITDTQILQYGGKLTALIRPLPMGKILSSLNWNVQWGFVFKKTIPFFWIPAHTITFLLPGQYQVLFAALLGVALGIILSIAAVMSRKNNN